MHVPLRIIKDTVLFDSVRMEVKGLMNIKDSVVVGNTANAFENVVFRVADTSQMEFIFYDTAGVKHDDMVVAVIMDSLATWSGIPAGASGSFDIKCDSAGTVTVRANADFNSVGAITYLYFNKPSVNINSSVADKFNIYASGGILTFENRTPGNYTVLGSYETCVIKIWY